MSQLFGPLHQLGYVVRDVESAMRHWTQELRIGPFYYLERVPLAEPGCVQGSVALTYSGETQIELIQQHDVVPGSCRALLDGGHEGLHHVGFLSGQYDTDLQRALESGLAIGQAGLDAHTGARFAYFASVGHPGTTLKLTELVAANRDLYRMIRKEAQRWDGSGPVRRLEF